MRNERIERQKEQMLSVFALVEGCQREIQAYRRGEPSHEAFGLELLHRAIEQGDQDAWAGLQQCWSELVRDWLYGHSRRETALSFESEESYVALAFERFWQSTTRQQLHFGTVSGALAYLHACLHGAILDALRAYSRPAEVPLPESGTQGELYAVDQIGSGDLWEVLQVLVPGAREQRLAYLLYHCGLKPREIVRFCAPEWGDVQEIYGLRRTMVERLRRNASQFRWRLNHQEHF
jgi:DNA-directed RNA polymerase specialized sigma24 family protein